MTGPGGGRSDAVLQDRLLTPEEARAVVSWAYEPPYDLYDLSGDAAPAQLTVRDEHGHGYYPVQAGGQVVGFVCVGAEARVRGQVEEAGTCDLGMGVDPGRLSEGLGTAVLPAAVRFAAERFGAIRVRAAVAAFNQRSLRLCTSAGFRAVREFAGPDDRPFLELVLDLRRHPEHYGRARLDPDRDGVSGRPAPGRRPAARR
jgi:ribosomal-protein-alanine N-acetyltransferase